MKNTKADDEIIFYVKDIKGLQENEAINFIVERSFISNRELKRISIVLSIESPVCDNNIRNLTANAMKNIAKDLNKGLFNDCREISVENLCQRNNVFDFEINNIKDYIFYLRQKEQFKYTYPAHASDFYLIKEEDFQNELELIVKNACNCISFFREQFVPFRTFSEKLYVKDMFQGKLLKKRGAHGNYFYKVMSRIFTEVYSGEYENANFIKIFKLIREKEGGIYKLTY
ncbi:MAG: hypothetical protein ACRCYT_06930 [Cetobacterium sp.]